MHERIKINPQGFDVIDMDIRSPQYLKSIEGCAVLQYHGYHISISTAGRYNGACLNEIRIDRPDGTFEYKPCSVQEAIDYVVDLVRNSDIDEEHYFKEVRTSQDF